MKKMNRLPHEQVTADGDEGVGPDHDGLPAVDDVEGHGAQFLPGQPGTGGDSLRRPTGSGEAIDEDDVEGHFQVRTKGERFGPGAPGTGGDEV
jgi:hypothetical protein